MNRFTRQMRLAEVGEAGQAKIAEARPRLLTHNAIERAYLSRAGVSSFEPSPEDALETAPQHERAPRNEDSGAGLLEGVGDWGVKHPAAREVLIGSLAALVSLRDILK